VVVVVVTHNLLTHLNRRVMQSRKDEEYLVPFFILTAESRKLYKTVEIVKSEFYNSVSHKVCYITKIMRIYWPDLSFLAWLYCLASQF
jgi:hypothetical protein